jgi:molecular chaperone DnaK (HSP70)
MKELVVGIDLGTTNSVVAYLDDDSQETVIIPNSEQERVTPSVVQFRPDGTVVVGAEAKAEIDMYTDSTAQFFKPDMGTDTTYEYGSQTYTPVDLSAYVLRKLKADTEAYLGREVKKAVITVPAYFHDSARNATIEAGKRAGLEVLRIINEPTAAILAYGVDRAKENATVMVYDLGGGTFDVTLARVAAGSVEVIGTDGNHELGGKNWDDRLLTLVAERFEKETGINPLADPYGFQALLVVAEQAKKELSARERTRPTVTAMGHTVQIEVTRAEFEQATSDLVDQTITLLEQVLQAATIPPGAVDMILLVGGSTRMTMCSNRLRELWGNQPSSTLNPDECVAAGAAMQAALLGSTGGAGLRRIARGVLGPRPAIRDVTAHSLGCIVVSADESRFLNSIILPRNSAIPATHAQTKVLTTNPNRNNELDVYLLQGESEHPTYNTVLGRYTFTGVPHYQGETHVRIEYSYDTNGVVQVRAFDEHSGQQLPEPKVTRDEVDIEWADHPPKEVLRQQDTTVYLAFDLSPSMSGPPLDEARNAAHAFVNRCDLRSTSIGLISFSDRVHIDLRATKDAQALSRAIEDLTIGITGQGNSGDPFDDIHNLLHDVQEARFAVVLADGLWMYQNTAIERARRCHQAEIQIVAVGFGNADRSFLDQIASSPDQSFFTDLRGLTDTFSSIARDIGGSGIRRLELGGQGITRL